MQVAFKGRRLGEFVWNRELLPGAEWTAGQWEKMAGCKQRPGTASKEQAGLSWPARGAGASVLGTGSPGKPACS